MRAKERLKDFLKAVRATGNTTYTFTTAGSEYDAQRYVHRMRVELSRFREKVRMNGQQLNPFKVKLVSLTPDDTEKTTIVTLQFINERNPELSRGLAEIFDVVASEGTTIDDAHARGVKKTPNLEFRLDVKAQ